MLIKSSSVLSTLFHLIDLDLCCSTSKLIWALEAIYLASSVPCNALKMLALYGLIFTAFDNGFIWCNFYLDFIAQNTIKKQPHQQ